MRAYKGVVENGVVVLVGTRLPEGTVVTVTVGEGELLRARITNVLKRPRKVRVRIKPNVGLATSGPDRTGSGVGAGADAAGTGSLGTAAVRVGGLGLDGAALSGDG